MIAEFLLPPLWQLVVFGALCCMMGAAVGLLEGHWLGYRRAIKDMLKDTDDAPGGWSFIPTELNYSENPRYVWRKPAAQARVSAESEKP